MMFTVLYPKQVKVTVKVKGKQSHYKPGQVQKVPGGSGSQISKTIGTRRK